MDKPKERPSAAVDGDRERLFDRPAQRFRQMMALSALVGLVSGLGEGLIDISVLHFDPPAILYVTVFANMMVFLGLGFLFWVLGLGLKPQLASFLVFFILLWALLHGWERQLTQDAKHGLLWRLSVAVSCLIAVLLSLWAWRHEQKVARILGRTFPWTFLVALGCLGGMLFYRPEVEQRSMPPARVNAENLPNVILIVVDTLRADHMSCYHYERLTSPNLDQVAANGVLFENAISPSSWTLPSHASMFTGLYPNQHGAEGFWDQLSADVPTIPEELERRGYETGAFSGSPFFTPRQGLGRGFNEFGDFSFSPMHAFTQVHYMRFVIRMMKMDRWVEENIGLTSGVDNNEYAFKWIEHVHRPFFLVLNYFEVHQPDLLAQSWRERFSAGQGAISRVSNEKVSSGAQVAPQIQKKIDEYDGAIAYDDDRLRKLLDGLIQRHLMDNTLLIVTADHGEGFGEHGLLTHGTALYYPLIHVPLIFDWPGHLPMGVRIKRPVSTKDIPATILGLLGPPDDQLRGKSLAALWKEQNAKVQWPLPISELVQQRQLLFKSSRGRDEIESIVSPELQLILNSPEGPALYDWRADPQERDNLFLSPPYDAVRKELAAELKSNR